MGQVASLTFRLPRCSAGDVAGVAGATADISRVQSCVDQCPINDLRTMNNELHFGGVGTNPATFIGSLHCYMDVHLWPPPRTLSILRVFHQTLRLVALQAADAEQLLAGQLAAAICRAGGRRARAIAGQALEAGGVALGACDRRVGPTRGSLGVGAAAPADLWACVRFRECPASHSARLCMPPCPPKLTVLPVGQRRLAFVAVFDALASGEGHALLYFGSARQTAVRWRRVAAAFVTLHFSWPSHAELSLSTQSIA